MNLLDEVIGYLSPTWQAQRLAARVSLQQLEQLATYPDAHQTRLDPTPLAPGTSPDWDLELGRDRRSMHDRVRQLLRSNVLARTLVERTADAVCGTGYRLQMRAKKPDGKPDDDYNHAAQDLHEGWAEDGADQREISTVHELNRLQFMGYMSDGESGFVKLVDGTMRGFESAELGDPAGYYRPGAVDGLMLDDQGRPQVYKIFKPSMYVLWSDRRMQGDRLEVRPRDVIFRARRSRLGQTRGETAFLGAFEPLEQLILSIKAITVGLRMSACLGLVIKTANDFNLNTEPDQNGQPRRTMSLSPGGILKLKPGEDVEQVTPNALTPEIERHLRLLVRLVASPWGQTLEIVLGDFGSLNLSSARANLLTAMRAWKVLQFTHASTYSAQLKWQLRRWIQDGKLKDRPDWAAHAWIKPKTLILDPLADAQAELLEVDAGFKTLREVAEERGWSFEDLVQALKDQRDLLRELELPRSSLTRDRLLAGEGGVAGKKQKPEQARRAWEKRSQTMQDIRHAVAEALRNSAA